MKFFEKTDTLLLFNTTVARRERNIEYFLGKNLEALFLIVRKTKTGFSTKVYTAGFETTRIKGSHAITDLWNQLAKELSHDKIIGINKAFISINEFNRLKRKLSKKFVDVSKDLVATRLKKSAAEIKKIQTVCRITDKILENIVSDFKFRSELEIQQHIYLKAREYGCTLAFSPIVANRDHAALPHHQPDTKKLKKGFLLLDFGVRKDGYCSDITRTFYIGNPSKQELDDYLKVLEVQKKCISAVKLGVSCAQLDGIARSRLGNQFIHSLGHGIGIEVHEGPALSEKSKNIVELGSVFTIEPGIYRKGKWGIRIEDDIAVTTSGVKVLTKFSKNLIMLKPSW
ncbi:M24 family metallopeptidase [Candidatus Woesearchaeota archaeon]|nr:M24 family metallopeptidase [Candidatus Woesearchaeota archaeon]